MKTCKQIYLTILVIFVALLCNKPVFCQWQQLPEPYGGEIYCIIKHGGNIFAGGDSLHISYDDGSSWETVRTFPGRRIVSLLSINQFLLAFASTGIYRSDDQGISWINIQFPSGGNGTTKILKKIGGTIIAHEEIGLLVPGIYISDDYGDSWRLPETEIEDDHVGSIDIIGDVVYACASGGIYRSFDHGDNWEVFTHAMSPGSITYANNMFVATSGNVCYRSSDGVNWETIYHGVYYSDVIIALDSSFTSGQRLLMGGLGWGGANGGLYYSDDTGETWAPVIDVNRRNNHVNSIWQNDSIVFVTTRSDGIMRSADNASTWTESNLGISGRTFVKIASDGETLVVSEWGIRELFISPDAGRIWGNIGIYTDRDEYVNCILLKDDWILIGTRIGLFRKQISDLAWSTVKPNLSFRCLTKSNGVIYASTLDTLFKSLDHGSTWTVCNQGEKFPCNIVCISAFDSLIVVGLSDSILFSQDYGEHFNSSSLPGAYSYMDCIIHDGSWFYLVTSLNGIYRFQNPSSSWEKVNDSTLNYIFSVVANEKQIYIASRDGGIVRSTDQGYTWFQYNESLPGNTVYGLILKGDTLFAVGETNYSSGFGIVKNSIYPAGIDTKNKPKITGFIYPNPASNSISLCWPSYANLLGYYSIFSTTGQLVQTGKTYPDKIIDVSNLTLGPYVFRFNNEAASISISFIISR